MEISGLGTFNVGGVRLAGRLLVDRGGSFGAGRAADEPVARHVHRVACFDISVYEAVERFCESIAFYNCSNITRSLSIAAALGFDIRYLADACYFNRLRFDAVI